LVRLRGPKGIPKCLDSRKCGLLRGTPGLNRRALVHWLRMVFVSLYCMAPMTDRRPWIRGKHITQVHSSLKYTPGRLGSFLRRLRWWHGAVTIYDLVRMWRICIMQISFGMTLWDILIRWRLNRHNDSWLYVERSCWSFELRLLLNFDVRRWRS
jgi:hypothetical protein